MVGQETANGGSIDTGIALATGGTVVIHDDAAAALEIPFKVAVWTGVATCLLGAWGGSVARKELKALSEEAEKTKVAAAATSDAAADTKGPSAESQNASKVEP